jgi:hypothetical protein
MEASTFRTKFERIEQGVRLKALDRFDRWVDVGTD